MSNAGSIFLLVGVVASAVYYSLYKVVSRLVIGLDAINIYKVTITYTTIRITLKITNPSNTDVILNNSALNLRLNGVHVGYLTATGSQRIAARSASDAVFYVDIEYSGTGEVLLNLINNGKTTTATPVVLTIDGKANISGLPVPIPAVEVFNFKVDDVKNIVTELKPEI